jgi:hypothetical protein
VAEGQYYVEVWQFVTTTAGYNSTLVNGEVYNKVPKSFMKSCTEVQKVSWLHSGNISLGFNLPTKIVADSSNELLFESEDGSNRIFPKDWDLRTKL